MLPRAYVEEILFDGGYSEILAGIVKEALEDWKHVVAKSPERMGGASSLQRSVYINNRVVELFEEKTQDDPNVLTHEFKLNTIFTIGNEITIRCKKLNDEMRAMGRKTRVVKERWYKQIPLTEEFERHVNITFGWRLNSIGVLEQLAFVNEYQDELHWLITVDEIGSKKQVIEALQFPVFNDDAMFDIAPRDSERAARIAREDEEANRDERTD